MNDVDICNLALSNIGQSESIAALTELSLQAKLCRRWYAQSRDVVLQDFPWPFATKALALAKLTSTPPPGWALAYAYPSDCLQAMRVCTAAGIRLIARGAWIGPDRWDADRFDLTQTKVPFTLQSGDDSTPIVIATDLDGAYLYYTRRVTNPEIFSPLFVQALAWKLGAAIARPLTQSRAIAQDAEQAYFAERDRAAAQAFNERTLDPEPDSPSILARG